VLFAVSESNNSIRKETYHPADDGRLLPDHHPGTENSRKAIIDNQELIPKSNPESYLQKRFPGSDIQVNTHQIA
jgi:hypothetical protein